ncbi:MAG: hypothetical protein ACMXX5_00385 [Candidatus Woesearchaeota archaeon]
MNLKIKYFAIAIAGLILFLFLSVIFMAIFRLCPPIEAGPQPPWCTNPKFFERDFSTAGLGGALRVKMMELFPYSQIEDSYYDPLTDNVDYFEKPEKINDYSIEFGIAITDFFWPVCRHFSLCIDPRKKIISTLSRIDSLGSDFIVFTDYIRIDDDKNIFLGKATLSQKYIDKKIQIAKYYGLKTMVLLNLFIDDASTRHMEMDDFDEDIRFGGSLMAKSVDYWDPNQENINLLFDNWEQTLLQNLQRWKNADYIIVNPEDTHFHFLSHMNLQNERNKRLIDLAKNNYNGNVCVHLNSLHYITSNPELDFYKKADCILIGGHFPYNDFEVYNDVNSFQEFFIDYFNNDFFHKDYQIYQRIATMSYDSYIENQWFEVWDLPFLNRTHESDFRLQANAYEGMFRALQKVQPKIAGIFHYGYWWDDVDFDDDRLNVAFMNSIRNKDAEHIFYRWQKILSVS